MKFSLVVVLFVCTAMMAQSKVATTPPAGVPAGATAVDGHTWRWVDKSGKAWLYRATPFGMMKTEEPKESAAKRPEGLPADAMPLAADTWRWIDKDGKAWLYKSTNAGLMKTEQPADYKAPEAPKFDAALSMISVKEEGDSLRFSKPGPFGTYSWVKKKTQLDKDEALVWEHHQNSKQAKK